MNKVDWQHIERVLAVIMDLPASERSARITQICGDRAELRAEVDSLLAAHEKAVSFLEVDTRVDSSAAAQLSSLEGKVLGPYRLLGTLGVGGMERSIAPSAQMADFKKKSRSKSCPPQFIPVNSFGASPTSNKSWPHWSTPTSLGF